MDLLKSVKVEEHTCRACARPCGLFDECDRCFLDRLESQFAELMDEAGQPSLPDGLMDEVEWTEASDAEISVSTPPPAVGSETEPDPEPEPDPAPEPESAHDQERKSVPPPPVPGVEAPVPVAVAASPPAERHARRWMLTAATFAVVAIAAVYVVLQGDDGVSTANPEQPPLAATDPPPAPVIGDWSGQIEVRYGDGTKAELTQKISIDGLEEGQVAGFSRSRQSEGSCWGPLTFTGMQGQAFAFDYRERNTKECIPTGEVTLTPRGDATLDYREVTKISVNRGTIAQQ